MKITKYTICIIAFFAIVLVAFAEPNQRILAAFKGYECDTVNGKVTKWRDARPQPTAQEWLAIAAEYEAFKSSDGEKVKSAASTEEMVEAMWAKFMEGDSTKADAIQARRNAAKAK